MPRVEKVAGQGRRTRLAGGSLYLYHTLLATFHFSHFRWLKVVLAPFFL